MSAEESPAITRARDNPFASHHLERLEFRLPGDLTWEKLVSRLAVLGYSGAIVGAHGSGKSTLIEQLAPHLEAKGFRTHLIHLNAETRTSDKDALLNQVRSLRAPDLLLLDGAEQLSTRQWLPLRVAADTLAGLVVTVHRSSRLPTLIETESTPALLNELVQELANWSLPEGDVLALHQRHRGNIRECFRELYDRWIG